MFLNFVFFLIKMCHLKKHFQLRFFLFFCTSQKDQFTFDSTQKIVKIIKKRLTQKIERD